MLSITFQQQPYTPLCAIPTSYPLIPLCTSASLTSVFLIIKRGINICKNQTQSSIFRTNLVADHQNVISSGYPAKPQEKLRRCWIASFCIPSRKPTREGPHILHYLHRYIQQGYSTGCGRQRPCQIFIWMWVSSQASSFSRIQIIYLMVGEKCHNLKGKESCGGRKI